VIVLRRRYPSRGKGWGKKGCKSHSTEKSTVAKRECGFFCPSYKFLVKPQNTVPGRERDFIGDRVYTKWEAGEF